jgi:hypothetical protein
MTIRSKDDGSLLWSVLGEPWSFLTVADKHRFEPGARRLRTLKADLDWMLESRGGRGNFETGRFVPGAGDQLKEVRAEQGRIEAEVDGHIPDGLTPAEFLERTQIELRDQELWKPQVELPGTMGPRHGEPCSTRPLAAGVDTLHLTWEATLLDCVLERLDALKEVAQGGDQAPVIVVGKHRFEVQGYGAKPCWRFILAGKTATLKIRRRPKAGQPTIMAELRSAYLWRHGADGAVRDIERAIEGWCVSEVRDGALAPALSRAKVSRLDMAVDVQGFEPTWHQFCEGHFVSRTRLMTAHYKNAFVNHDHEDLEGALHFSGGRLQGLTFGRGDTSARIYDKTHEIKRSGKRWMEAVWRAAGWVGEKVWRLEFQLRGEGLKNWLSEFRFGAEGSRGNFTTGKYWWSIRKSLDGIWGYLTGREGRGWLTLKTPSGDTNRTRWEHHPAWQEITSLRWPAGAESVTKLPQLRNRTAPRWVREVRKRAEANRRVWDRATPEARKKLTGVGCLPGFQPDPELSTRPWEIVKALGAQATVAYLAAQPSREMWEGDVFRTRHAACGVAMNEGHAKALQLAPQVVGCAVALGAAVDVACALDDPRTETEAVDRILGAVRGELMKHGGLKKKMAGYRDRHYFREAWDRDLREVTA